MIDESLLADPTRCPACAALLPDSPECPACHLPLRGPTAGRLWTVSTEASRLLAERARLIAMLRAEGSAPSYVAPPLVPAHAAAAHPAAVPAPREEWTPRRVQNLLLALGVVLLGVAAVIFVAVSWGRLGVGGRAAVMTGVTALSFLAGTMAHRRGLTATAEAVSLLTVGLALLDCAGAWSADLAGLRDVDGLVVAAGSAAIVSALAGLAALTLPTRALRLSSAVLGQLAPPLLGLHAADASDHPAAVLAAFLTGQALVSAAVAVTWPGRGDSRDARRVVAVGGVVTATLAAASALGAAYLEPGSVVVGSALLLVLAALAAAAAETPAVIRSWLSAPDAGRGTAAGLTVAAAWAVVLDVSPLRWVPPALAAVAAVQLAATSLLPRSRRFAPAVVTAAAAVGPAVAALPVLIAGLAGRLQWIESPWTVSGGPARQLLDLTTGTGGATWSLPAAAVLALAAATVVVAPYVVDRARAVRPAAAPLAAAAVWLLPVAADLGYAPALGADLLLAAALLLAGVVLVARRAAPVGWAALATGAAILAAGLAWSLAVDVATLTALPVGVVVLAAVTVVAARAGGLRELATGAAVCAGLLVVAQSAAVARFSGADWPAVWSTAMAVLVALTAAGSLGVALRAPAAAYWIATRRALLVVAVAGVLVEAASLSRWLGAGIAEQGLAVAVTGAALLALSTIPAPERLLEPRDVRMVAGLGCALAVPVTAVDPDRLWLSLLAVGVGVAVLGLREDHRWGWLSGLLLTASSWVRLAESDVEAPEAYTVPPGVALLVVGWLRRRRDPQVRSWPAYAPGLLLALVPSLLRAVTDAGTARPLLLGVAALAVLAVGVARRLQAPLVIGGAVLAVDAVVQLAPYLVALYDAVPRWVTIGLVGLALVGAGATYERRVQELRRVGRQLAELG